MQLVPARFLFRLSRPCYYVADLPDDDEDLFDLPESCRLDTFAGLDGRDDFADVRMAWNEGGLAVQVTVKGKDLNLSGDLTRPRLSDGLSLWIDTRDSRTSHRASRFCHQFHFLPTGAGPDRTEPGWVQTPIHRAIGESTLADPREIDLRVRRPAGGYRMAAWIGAAALTGYDPEQNPKMGMFYVLRDTEKGEQSSGVMTDLPFAEDPSLWGVLEMVKS